MSEKKYIIFTDLKDFTYKNSLLTDTQISEILSTFQHIVEESAKQRKIKIVKSIGDAYFSVSEDPEDAYNFAKDILEQS
jgi:class 3 adenylate cyclase